MKKIICALALAGFSNIAFAQNNINNNVYVPVDSWDWGGRLAVVSIDEETALTQGVDDTAYLIGFEGNYRQSSWVTSLGMDIVVYDDNEEFSQTVIGDGLFNDGDVSVESSSATGVLVSVATGYEWRFTASNEVALQWQVGYSHMFASDRSIDNCNDCFSEDIDVDGGVFTAVSLMKSNKDFDLGLLVQQYLSGDGLDNSIGLRFSLHY